MKTIIAKNSGYCYGVKRALKIVEETLDKYKDDDKKVYSIGEIIHNRNVVKGLSDNGLKIVKDKEDVPDGSVFLVRSHGMPPGVLKEFEKRNIEVIDATCPFVKKAQAKAKKLAREGYFVILIGDKKHPEVRGIKEHSGTDDILVVIEKKDLAGIKRKKKIGIILQTTQTMEKFKSILDIVIEKADRIMIENTICNTTSIRQESTAEIAKKVDLMIVVGGKNSANTTHLAEISRKILGNTFHIENFKEIEKKWFDGVEKVGISGGASTPFKDIEDTANFIESI